MTTTTKQVPATRLAILNCSSAVTLMNQMLEVILNIQTMDAESLYIYKNMIVDLGRQIKDNAEIRFLEGVLGLISAATKDQMVDMETLLDDDDDGTVIEPKDFQVSTKDLELPPANTIEKPNKGMTVSKTSQHLWLTNDVVDTMTVGGKDMAVVTSVAGASPIVEIDIWGFSHSPWPEAYKDEYKLVRPISATAMKLWKGETEVVGGVRCVVIKCAFDQRSPAAKKKANDDLINNRG